MALVSLDLHVRILEANRREKERDVERARTKEREEERGRERERRKTKREEQVTRLPGRPTINLLANGYALRIIIQSSGFCLRQCPYKVQPLRG